MPFQRIILKPDFQTYGRNLKWTIHPNLILVFWYKDDNGHTTKIIIQSLSSFIFICGGDEFKTVHSMLSYWTHILEGNS